MKTKKSSHIKRARAATSHRRAVRRRPVHKRVMLHPLSVFMLLCVGVLVAGSTFRGQAATYDVTAKVSAPALTEPAVIVQPNDQQRISAPLANVVGTCPDESYVKLYRNDAFSGSAICNVGNHFTIQTGLSPGANRLLARVFNLTDDEGPASPPVTIYYDRPAVIAPPSSPPAGLEVLRIEVDGYRPGVIMETGSNPLISGLAPPASLITVTFYSDPVACKTKADNRGVWGCALSSALPAGLHRVVVSAVTPAGQALGFAEFRIRAAEVLKIISDYKYSVYHGGTASWRLSLSGGRGPFRLNMDWGDGSTSQMVREDRSEFILSHKYSFPSAEQRNYDVVVKVTDENGTLAVLQLPVAVEGSGEAVAGRQNIFTNLFSGVQRWLWVVWPAYIAVVLMTISFWIGEREAYQRFLASRRIARPRPHARGR